MNFIPSKSFGFGNRTRGHIVLGVEITICIAPPPQKKAKTEKERTCVRLALYNQDLCGLKTVSTEHDIISSFTAIQ